MSDLIEILRFSFYERFVIFHVDCAHNEDIRRVMADDFWLKKYLNFCGGNVSDAFQELTRTCKWRETNKVNELAFNRHNDIMHSTLVKQQGKDKKGNKLLLFEMSELNSPMKLDLDVLYWFEKLFIASKNLENISLLFIFGKDECMEDMLTVMSIFNDIIPYYQGFVDSIFIVDNLLSMACRQNLSVMIRIQNKNGVIPTFIKNVNVKDYVDLDFCKMDNCTSVEFEKKSNEKDSKIESPKKTEISNAESNSQDSSSISANIEWGKSDLKEVLKKLNEIQIQVNGLIAEVVQKLI